VAREKPRILFLDLETLPDMESAFDRWTTLSRWFGVTFGADLQSIICFGYAWDDSPAKIINAWDFPSWKRNVNDDKALCRAIAKIFTEADIIVTQNGKDFDWKVLNTRMLIHGLPPLPPVVHIDTKREAKRFLKLSSNSLGNLGKLFTDDEKMENGGWPLWSAVRRREAKAMKTMSRYCRKDVDVLRKIFRRLEPLLENSINRNLFLKEGDLCPRCGSSALRDSGTRRNKNQEYTRLFCMTCEGWCKRTARGKIKL
jgi:DNA polymerase elongation subunit (family B)